MKTPEQIKKGLVCPVRERGTLLDCSNCTYHGKNLKPCRIAVSDDALAYIELLEEQIALMKIQMRGDCGVCRHRDSKGEPCASCMIGAGSRPNWEYEGLPELAVK